VARSSKPHSLLQFVVAGCILHAGIVLAVHARHTPAHLRESVLTRAETFSLDIELENEARVASTSISPKERATRSSKGSASRVATHANDAEAALQDPSKGSAAFHFNPLKSNGARAQAQQLPSSFIQQPDPVIEPDAKEQDTGQLRSALKAGDVKRGLGLGTFAARALETVARESELQVLGTAAYDVTISKEGAVSVSFLQASDHAAHFKALAASAQARIQAPERARKLRLRVVLDIHDQYPDGRKPEDVGNIKVHADQGKFSETKDQILIDRLPGIGVHATGKVCSGGVSLTPTGPVLGAGCSLENIGAPARRMVSARVTEEVAL
jgi:hypothetical protein